MSDAPHAQRQVMASFATHEAADSAIQYLTAEAIPRDQISIRTSDTGLQPVQAPGETDGVVQEDEQRNLRTMGTSIASAGAAMAAAGVVVATGGAALPAVAAAAAAGLGAGAVTQGVSNAATPDVVPDSEKAVAVLTVNVANADQAERAKGVLRKVSAIKVWEE
ncbi:hypothetical protein [Roseomonas populi]|uniref:Uncharacterized protein n=1 Tax=Roseomonas populi TaxID=3121582 RepID=A0ABT1X9G6_9PROT|nr:hypothetical protein [Roseomonas pecuniae]MCR0984749.1 hypothetical protein [Roseomonas pecuniae]